MASQNSFNTRTPLTVGRPARSDISACPRSKRPGFRGVARLPYSLKILLENLLRREDGRFVDADDIQALAGWDVDVARRQKEIAFMPARVLLQDFTGVPAVVDLAAMRDGIVRLGGDPKKVNPLQPVELVIDHSVQVDHYRRAQRRRPQRRARVRAQQGALHVPALGPGRLPELPRRAARHRHRPPGQPRIPRARDLSASTAGGDAARLSRHARRHRLAHDDGQRARRRRLGRRRHRGRSRDARPADLDADSRSRRLPPDRSPARRARRRPISC